MIDGFLLTIDLGSEVRNFRGKQVQVIFFDSIVLTKLISFSNPEKN
jgi:hypothetical protein